MEPALVDRNGLEVLEGKECLRLLGTVSLCRVGVTLGALPAILPVNFALRGDRVYIRSAGGTKLYAALRNSVVALEADDFDPHGSRGWSVLVRGRSYEVTRPEELAEVAELPRPWAGDFDKVVGVHIEMISGRRIRPRS